MVRPLFFPGGDIGTLAVNGTVNDLAMCGARPLYLSAGFILEEGLPMDTLWRVVQSMKLAAEQAGVQLVTGDTKVVDRGKGDGIFINTAGIGVVESSHAISPANVKPGDAILLSGDIGRHGIAIMAVREGLEFESTIESDCAALSGIVLDLIKRRSRCTACGISRAEDLPALWLKSLKPRAFILKSRKPPFPCWRMSRAPARFWASIRCMSPTKDDLSASFPRAKRGARCEQMRAHPLGAQACIIGTVKEDNPGLVTMRSRIGATRIVDMLSGEQLPRIC